MTQQTVMARPETSGGVRARALALMSSPPRQAFSLLYFAYVAAPIIAGLDKFFHYLVDWDIYVSPLASAFVGGHVAAFMRAAGVVEIAAGLLVAARPRWGGLVVAVWLWGIIANLLLIPGYFDVALRDFGLSLGALALSRLALFLEDKPGA